jgi:hypothetical protein
MAELLKSQGRNEINFLMDSSLDLSCDLFSLRIRSCVRAKVVFRAVSLFPCFRLRSSLLSPCGNTQLFLRLYHC